MHKKLGDDSPPQPKVSLDVKIHLNVNDKLGDNPARFVANPISACDLAHAPLYTEPICFVN